MVSVSTSAAISRGMRSARMPCSDWRSAAASASPRSHGICANQSGALRRISAIMRSTFGGRTRRCSASSTGMYGSCGPCCSTHPARPIHTGTARSPIAREARKASTSAVFPDPGGAGDEDDLPIAGLRRGKAVGQKLHLGVAADEARGRLLTDVRGRRKVQRRRGARRGRGLVGGRPRCDEAKAAAMHRLEEARRAAVVAEREAQLADRLVERIRSDGDVRPDRVEQLVARDQHFRPLRQVQEHGPRFRSQRHGAIAVEELAGAPVDAKRAERDGFSAGAQRGRVDDVSLGGLGGHGKREPLQPSWPAR